MIRFISSSQRRMGFFFALFVVAVFLSSCMVSVTGSKPAPFSVGNRKEQTPTARAICQTSQLLLTEGRGGAALGHQSTPFTFENHSQQTCTLSGYPALKQLDAGRKPITEPIQQSPVAYTYNTQGPRIITLAPGGKAYFLIERTDVCASPFVYFLLITPPGNKTPFLVDLRHATASPQTFSPMPLPGNQASLLITMHVSACEDTVTISPLVATVGLLSQ
ncbi:MAG: DUF4232 domain-containing protein [Ktedonobacteraceae bacterium]